MPSSASLLTTLAANTGVALENARLFQEVESARKVILQSRDTLRTLFDGILEGIYIVDRDNVILAINRTQARWAGREVEDLVGQSAQLAFPPSQRSLELIEEKGPQGFTLSEAAADGGVAVCIMHMQGVPATMQDAGAYFLNTST